MMSSPCFFHARHTPVVAKAELGSLARTTMAASVSGCFSLAACVFCCLISCSKSDGAAAAAFHGEKRYATDIVGRALFCFNDRYVYSACEGWLRLGPAGSLLVPPASTEAFCGGPCLAETELVLGCIDGIMANFRFYNGASVGDVRFALDRGCGHTALRGDFDVLRRLGGGDGNYGDGYFFGGGSRTRWFVSGGGDLLLPLLLLSVVAAIINLWG
ncbi:hypothetical protein ACP4OV_031989 [Aristida adscensionis]